MHFPEFNSTTLALRKQEGWQMLLSSGHSVLTDCGAHMSWMSLGLDPGKDSVVQGKESEEQKGDPGEGACCQPSWGICGACLLQSFKVSIAPGD